jgi:cell division protease FtsH
MTYSDDEGEVFLGHSITQHKMVSDETAHIIDEEVRKIVDRNYDRAKTILTANMEKLHLMAEALVKYETLDSEQIDDIMAGRVPRSPANWVDDDRGTPTGARAGTGDKPETGSGIGGPASLH